MIYNNLELSNFNNTLLQRGAPNTNDSVGYNKSDYSICNNYYDILTNEQLADLSHRLIKYCNTQLNLSKDDMKATKAYYISLLQDPEQTSVGNCISIKVVGDYTTVAFKYNTTYVGVVKKAKDRSYDKETKTWSVNNREIERVLNNLQDVGANCQLALEYVKENIVVESSTPIAKATGEKISVTEGKKGFLEIGFKYNMDIVNAIKELETEGRRYKPLDKVWEVDITEVKNLISVLSKVENIDYSELNKYDTVENQKVENSTEVPVQEFELMNTDLLERKPFGYQIEGANFLLEKRSCILADDMGLGKSFQSVLAMESIRGKKLVVCPASLKLNWEKEIRIVNKNARVYIINGKGYDLKSIDENDYIITNYDVLNRDLEAILATDYKCLVLDEAHYIKAINNSGKPSSRRAEAVLEIADKIEYNIVLTGTPIPNFTKDIFNLLKVIKSPLARNFSKFAHKYCNATHNGYGWDFTGSSSRELLNEELQTGMLRRLKEDMLDLPEKIITFIPLKVNLSEYNKAVDDYMRNRKSFTTQGQHLVKLNTMREKCAIAKIKDTIEFAENILEQGQQVVIFTNFQKVVDEMVERFGDIATKITGDCSSAQRQQSVDEFQNGDKKVIVCNIVAGGTGITLTASNVVIFCDYAWSPSLHSQAMDRIYRIGQKNTCNIYFMSAKGTIDEKISEMLDEKLKNINTIVDGDEVSFMNGVKDSF